jgi:D-ribose pyranase
MKKEGILNAQLNHLIARLGHTDMIAIADCGLPIPDHVERIDLALMQGIPSFEEVIRAIAQEIVVEKIYLAQEVRERNRPCHEYLQRQFAEIEMEEIPHEELKKRLAQTKAVIRTGEATPYSNVILVCGVAF